MEDIFISGYSGRFPNSPSVQSLFDNLKQKKDCIGTSKRYPKGYLDLPERAGHLNEIDKFDALFFKMNKSHVEGMDIQIRILLEVVYEALVDSGLSIEEIKNSNTGVYVGNCFSDYHNGIIQNIYNVNGYENLGSAISMSANKISYFFDLKGPSIVIDTACSSSLHALSVACNDIQSGKIDKAIVAGVSLNLRPVLSKVFQKYNMLSPDGTCYSFDDRANGYCRSESINAIILQKEYGYVRIIGQGINSNGTTEQGITFPNVDKQVELFDEVCNKYNIDKTKIEYIEAHGTGTTAGDNVEITALDKVYGSSINTNNGCLYLGSIKSSIGHAEGASGLNSIIKCIMNYEIGHLLPNIHYDTTSHKPIVEGRFTIATDIIPFNRGYSVVNNFGFGGTNAHVVLANGNYEYVNKTNEVIKKVFARTQEECDALLRDDSVRSSYFEDCLDKSKFGYFGVKMSGIGNSEYKIVKSIQQVPKLVYIYSGQGSNYNHMGKELYINNIVFKETIHRLNDYLIDIIKQYTDTNTAAVNEENDKYRLIDLFLNGDLWLNKKYSSIGITAIQLGLTNILLQQGFEPDYIIGHSMGEIGCAYADKCLTEYQCIYISFIRSKLVEKIDKNTFFYHYSEKLSEEKEIVVNDGKYVYQVMKGKSSHIFEDKYPNYILKQDNHGKMLFVSSTEESIVDMLAQYSSVNIACYNSNDGLTLSGSYDEVSSIETYFKRNGIFCKEVETDGVAYHSTLLAPYTSYLIDNFSIVIPCDNIVKRSSKWLSTSDVNNELCDARYHTKNIVGSVYFYQQIEKLNELNDDSSPIVFLEISPNDGMLGQIKRTRTQFQKISSENTVLLSTLSKKSFDMGSVDMQKMLCQLWVNGVFSKKNRKNNQVMKLSIENRYKIRWDHSETWKTVTYKDFDTNNINKEVVYDLKKEYPFLLDHVIQKKSLFPAMGHVYTIWKIIGLKNKLSISNFCIYKAIVLTEEMNQLVFQVVEMKMTESNKYDIYYQEELVASAESYTTKQGITSSIVSNNDMNYTNDLSIDKHMFYGILSRYGYEYKGTFRMIDKIYKEGSLIKSANHWISLLDGLLQTSITSVDGLFLPTKIGSICIETYDMPLTDVFVWKNNKSLIVNNYILINWLETTLAPSGTESLESVMNASRFIPYHETFENSKTTLYSKKVRQFVKTRFRFNDKSTEEVENTFEKYPHLENIRTIIQDLETNENELELNACINEDINEYELYLTILSDMFSQFDTFMTNPAYEMSVHPLYSKLYETDSIFTIDDEYLCYCTQVMNENLINYSVLEIGTGTGGFLRRIYPKIENNISTYYASDKTLIHNSVLYKDVKIQQEKIDINNLDVINLDVNCIIGSNVLHICENIETTLEKIYDILNTDGFLLIEESICELPIYLFGCDKFIWSINDNRDYGLWNNHDSWLGIFEKSPFTLVSSYNNGITGLYLLKKVENKDKEYIVVEKVEENINVLEENVVFTVPADGFVKSVGLEPDVNSVICAYNNNGGDGDGDGDESLSKQVLEYALKAQLKMNIMNDGKYGSYRMISTNILQNNDKREFEIRIDKPGNVSSLSFYQIKEGDIEVCYTGLNFKDVMLSYGKLKDVPSNIQLGLEFSGIKSGKKVMGMGLGMFKTSIDSNRVIYWDIPEEWCLKESATLPCVYSTVYYSLDYKCRMSKGQSILIHAGAGGIGQSAISLCLKRGLNVYTTCSESKRDFLKKKFGLKDNQIGNSRDNSFYDWIMKETSGEGVDIVLNSLSEEKLLLSLECVKSFGQFCEIGKYDILQNNKIGLQVLNNNVSFHVIDLSTMFSDNKYKIILQELIQYGLENHEIEPLNIDRVFHYDEIDSAIRYMGGGNHIGKILVDMKNSKDQINKISIKDRYITKGTHLITGGMGGFGLELAEWLVRCGAEKVLLVGRTGVSNLYQKAKLDKYNGQLEYVYGDITNEGDVSRIFNKRDISGIWHLAMRLIDKLYKNMSKDDWDNVVNVKQKGAELLDKYCPINAMFVCFSSISSLFGNAGQTNYSYGNFIMEEICRKRRNSKKHGMSICWGPIDNIGYLTQESSIINKLMFLPQNIDDCLNDLHTLLNMSEAVVSCYKVNPDFNKNNNVSESGELSLLHQVISIIGLKWSVVETLNKTTTLQELGMDSLQSASVKNVLKTHGKDIKDIFNIRLCDL